MITNNGYVQYKTMSSNEEIQDWLNDENIYSNREDYKTVIHHQCNYKDKHSYSYGKKKNKKVYNVIYAHNLEVMIPVNMTIEEKHQFIQKFMIALSPCFKLDSFLYCYKFTTQGEGCYIDVICFTRKYFKRKQVRKIRYNRDMYWNPNTKKLCKENHPNAVLNHHKGEVKKDKDGNDIEEEYYVSKVEKEVFKYTSFKKFHKRLLKAQEYANLLLNRDFWKQQIKYFSRTTITRSSYKNKEKICLKNMMITRINSLVNDLQYSLYMTRDWDDVKAEFYKLVFKIDKILRLTNWKDPVSNKNIYFGTNQDITVLNDALILKEDYIVDSIRKWWADNI